MKKSRFQTGRTSAYLNQCGPASGVDVEMVTDSDMLVQIVVDVSDGRIDQAAWTFAHAVDVVALFLEDRQGHPFRAFTVVFTAAWGFVSARKLKQRRKSAELPALPPFLGGGVLPGGE